MCATGPILAAPTIIDSASNTWTQIYSDSNTASGMWYAVANAASGSGPVTATMNVAGNIQYSFSDFYIAELSGWGSPANLYTASSTGTGGPVTTVLDTVQLPTFASTSSSLWSCGAIGIQSACCFGDADDESRPSSRRNRVIKKHRRSSDAGLPDN